MMKPIPEKDFSLSARVRSFSYACKGIRSLIKEQYNFRIHLLATVIVVVSGVVLQVSFTEWAILILCVGLVLSMETINTAIESAVDYISPEFHPLAGKIKDLSAAAVLISAIASACSGFLIFIPKIIRIII